MHELSLVEALIDECDRRAAGRPVRALRVRLAPGLGPDELRQAFGALSGGTALAGAELEVEVEPTRLACGCGFAGVVDEADVAGHMVVCPACGRIHPAAAGGVEVLALSFAQ